MNAGKGWEDAQVVRLTAERLRLYRRGVSWLLIFLLVLLFFPPRPEARGGADAVIDWVAKGMIVVTVLGVGAFMLLLLLELRG